MRGIADRHLAGRMGRLSVHAAAGGIGPMPEQMVIWKPSACGSGIQPGGTSAHMDRTPATMASVSARNKLLDRTAISMAASLGAGGRRCIPRWATNGPPRPLTPIPRTALRLSREAIATRPKSAWGRVSTASIRRMPAKFLSALRGY